EPVRLLANFHSAHMLLEQEGEGVGEIPCGHCLPPVEAGALSMRDLGVKAQQAVSTLLAEHERERLRHHADEPVMQRNELAPFLPVEQISRPGQLTTVY